MRSYDKLNAKMGVIQKVVEAKNKKHANALNAIKHLCKVFAFTAGILKS